MKHECNHLPTLASLSQGGRRGDRGGDIRTLSGGISHRPEHYTGPVSFLQTLCSPQFLSSQDFVVIVLEKSGVLCPKAEGKERKGKEGKRKGAAALPPACGRAPSPVLGVPLEVKQQPCPQICLSTDIPAGLARRDKSLSSEKLARIRAGLTELPQTTRLLSASSGIAMTLPRSWARARLPHPALLAPSPSNPEAEDFNILRITMLDGLFLLPCVHPFSLQHSCLNKGKIVT